MSSNSPGSNDENDPNRHHPPERPPENGEETNREEAVAFENESNAAPNPNVGDVAVAPDPEGEMPDDTLGDMVRSVRLFQICGRCGRPKVPDARGVPHSVYCEEVQQNAARLEAEGFTQLAVPLEVSLAQLQELAETQANTLSPEQQRSPPASSSGEQSTGTSGQPEVSFAQLQEREANSLPEEQQRSPSVLSFSGQSAKSSKRGDQQKGRGSYKCGRCGAPKKGHSCPYDPLVLPGKEDSEEDDRKPAAKPSSTVAAPTSGGEPTMPKPVTEETVAPEPPAEDASLDRESTKPAVKLDEASDRKRALPTEEEGSRKESKTEHASLQEETEVPTSESAVGDVESPTDETLDPNTMEAATFTNPADVTAPSTETQPASNSGSHQDDETDDDIETA